MDVQKRIEIERRIVEKVVDDFLALGYCLTVYDGEAWPVKRSRDRDVVVDFLFGVDESKLYVHEGPNKKSFGHVYFVFGNDGYDVICDHTVNLEEALKGATELAESIENEVTQGETDAD